MIHTPITRANLDLVVAAAEPHLKPIITAVRDCRVAMLFVPQSAQPFRIPRNSDRPAIILIGDDFAKAVGPDEFHSPSIRRAIRACDAFAVISSAAVVDPYAAMAVTTVATRRNTLIVETRPEQEIAWVSLIQKLAPGRFIWLSTVEGAKN